MLAGAFLLAACGSDDASDGGGGAPAQTIELVATEFAFDPATVELDAPGTYTFTVRNEGGAVHALEIEGNGFEEETEEIQAGESAELTVELGAGEYELYCPVGNHREQGMEGTLVVGGAGAGTTTGDDTTTDDDTTTEDEDGYSY